MLRGARNDNKDRIVYLIVNLKPNTKYQISNLKSANSPVPTISICRPRS
ncbi:DUF1410 domain-containing protein [Phormidium nigroviride]